MKGCFEATDWDVLCDPHGHMTCCVDTIFPSRTVKCFLNNKPWITTDLKELLNEKKKRFFRNGDREEQSRLPKELNVKLKESRDV